MTIAINRKNKGIQYILWVVLLCLSVLIPLNSQAQPTTIELPSSYQLMMDSNHSVAVDVQSQYEQISALWDNFKSTGPITDKEIFIIDRMIQQTNRTIVSQMAVINAQNQKVESFLNEHTSDSVALNRLKQTNANAITSDRYINTLRQIHYFVSDNQNTLIHLESTENLLNILNAEVVGYRLGFNSHLFSLAHQPFYSLSTWRDAYLGAITASHQLSEQMFDSHQRYVAFYSAPSTWAILFAIILGMTLYFRYLYNLTKKLARKHQWHGSKENRWMMVSSHIFLNGMIIPLLFMYYKTEIFNFIPTGESFLVEAFYSAIIYSIAFYLIGFSAISAFFSRHFGVIPRTYRVKQYLPRNMKKLLLVVSGILFINGINFFSIQTYSVVFLPKEAVGAVNLILSPIFSYYIIKILMIWRHIDLRLIQHKMRLSSIPAVQSKIKKISYTASYLMVVGYPLLNFFGLSNFANIIMVNLLQTLTTFIIMIAIYQGVAWTANQLLQLVNERLEMVHKVSHHWVYWIKFTTSLFLAVGTIIFVLLLWGANPHYVYTGLNAVLFDGFKFGELSISVYFFAHALFVFALVYLFFRAIVIFCDRKVFPFTSLTYSSIVNLRTLIGYIGIFMATILMFYSIGITGSSLTFLASAFVLGISFGLQEIFKNLVSGILLITERPIKIGDWVKVNDILGTVKRIQLRATVIETFDKETLIVPNSHFITQTISNELYTPISRVVIAVEVSYDDDPDKAIETLLSIPPTIDEIYTDPVPSAIFSEFKASGLEFKLMFFCETISRLKIASRVRAKIVYAFREQGIEIPYQKIDMYIKEVKNMGKPEN